MTIPYYMEIMGVDRPWHICTLNFWSTSISLKNAITECHRRANICRLKHSFPLIKGYSFTTTVGIGGDSFAARITRNTHLSFSHAFSTFLRLWCQWFLNIIVSTPTPDQSGQTEFHGIHLVCAPEASNYHATTWYLWVLWGPSSKIQPPIWKVAMGICHSNWRH